LVSRALRPWWLQALWMLHARAFPLQIALPWPVAAPLLALTLRPASLPIVARLDDFWCLQILLCSLSSPLLFARWSAAMGGGTRPALHSLTHPLHHLLGLCIRPSLSRWPSHSFFAAGWPLGCSLAPLAAAGRLGAGPCRKVAFLVWALPFPTGPLIPLPACGPLHELMQVTEERRMVQWGLCDCGWVVPAASPKVGKDRGQPADEIHPDPSG
jgi:hypothetical protein